MTILRTNVGNTIETARRYRFEPVAPLTATNVQTAIEQIASGGGQAITPTPVNAAMSPYTVLIGDVVLYVDTSGGPIEIDLPLSAERLGKPISIKDVSGNGATNNITVKPFGAETIDSLATYPINSDFGGIRLNPLDSGYTVAP